LLAYAHSNAEVRLVKRQVHRVKLGGELGLRDADGVREQLLAALHDHASVQIDTSGLTAIDISIVQVLIAAQKTAKHRNQSLKISAKAEGPFAEGCPANPALVSVALTAKDHIAKLIEHADASGGAEILAALSRIVAGQPAHSPLSEAPAEAGGTGMRNWRIRFSLPRDALVSGANPLLLLDEIRALGPCNVIAITDDIPPLDHLEAEICYLGWDIELSTERPVEAIDDVFMFLRDDMVIDIAPLAAPTVGDRPVDKDDAPAKSNKSKRATQAEVQRPQPGSGENSTDSAAPAMPRQADGGEGAADKIPLSAVEECVELTAADARHSGRSSSTSATAWFRS